MRMRTLGITLAGILAVITILGYFNQVANGELQDALGIRDTQNSSTATTSTNAPDNNSTGQGAVLGDHIQHVQTNDDLPISAEAGIVFDPVSSTSLYAKNTATPRPIASLTKLLTAIVYLEHNREEIPGETTTIYPDEYTIGGTLQVEEGEQLTASDLFNLMLVGSVNNATNALARTTGLSKSSFVQLMNEKAESMALPNAQFTDPTGLDTTNVATPEEVARLASVAFQNEYIATASRKPEYSFAFIGTNRDKTVKNTNALLRTHPEIDWRASKTGYLNEAGWCLITMVNIEGKNYVIGIFNAASKEQQFQDMLTLIEGIQNGTIS